LAPRKDDSSVRFPTYSPAACQAALFLILSISPAWSADQAVPPRLWQDAPPQPAPEQPLPAKKPWVIRQRDIVFDPQLLALLRDATARPHPPIAIELFEGRDYELDVTSTVSRLSDLSTVRGTLKDTARATWSLALNGNLVSGTIQVGDRLYKVEHVQNDRHRLLEVDPKKAPPD
jgi:hypothetical protein